MNDEMKFCQSCGMPMTEESLYGTERDGARSELYCTYCYQNGAFTQEGTMEEMIAANPHIRDIAVLGAGEEVRVP